jgi:hypothetical protein
MKKALLISLILVCLRTGSAIAAEAFEVGAGHESELPQGKEADGIRGDFVLKNDKVIALISQNAPLRRANMSTFYGPDGVTPGCLYDLTFKDEQNDQLIYCGPAGQRGQVSWVRVMPGSKDKKAAVETVVTSSKSNGLFKRHEYRMHDGEQGVWIITTFRNEGTEPVKVSTKDAWTRFNETGTRDGVLWADAVDPADKAGYALGALPMKGTQSVKEEEELAPKQEITWARFLAVGHSPAEAWGVLQSMRSAKTGQLKATITDEAGKPITTASLVLMSGESKIKGYPDASGVVSLSLPEGKNTIQVEDLGRLSKSMEVKISSGEVTKTSVKLEAASRLTFSITGENGKGLPCKAQMLGIEGTAPLDLGPPMRAHGCKDQYHSENGSFTVQVPAGKYHVVVTHGIEFNHFEEDVTVEQGKEVAVKAALKRILKTDGWISTDFHNHSTQSGDNICGTADRIINIAAENIEFAPTTEHNRIYDWRPIIDNLGLSSEIQTVVGMELTGSAAHLNCFPLTVEPFLQDNGAPVWNADARITALTLRGWQGERDDRWIQINHPDFQFLFNDRNLDGKADGGLVGIERVVEGMETENFTGDGVLADSPWRLSKGKTALATKVEYVRQFIWLQLLNKGFRITPIAVADAHSVHGNGVGSWRMYLPSKTDEPSKIDWTGDLAKHAKAGHIMLTTGPFLEVTTADGKLPGDDIVAHGGVDLHVKVQCTDWQDIDRVQVLVNGRKEPSLNFTRKSHPKMFTDGVVKFDQTITVPLKEDAHLIVVATHETMTLQKGYGTSDQSSLHPMAYHTPIYVDTDDDGFKANGDDLGYELPVAKMTPDMVREKLEKPAPTTKAKENGGS